MDHPALLLLRNLTHPQHPHLQSHQAYSECPNYDELVAALLSAPLPEVLKRCRLQPGT